MDFCITGLNCIWTQSIDFIRLVWIYRILLNAALSDRSLLFDCVFREIAVTSSEGGKALRNGAAPSFKAAGMGDGVWLGFCLSVCLNPAYNVELLLLLQILGSSCSELRWSRCVRLKSVPQACQPHGHLYYLLIGLAPGLET